MRWYRLVRQKYILVVTICLAVSLNMLLYWKGSESHAVLTTVQTPLASIRLKTQPPGVTKKLSSNHAASATVQTHLASIQLTTQPDEVTKHLPLSQESAYLEANKGNRLLFKSERNSAQGTDDPLSFVPNWKDSTGTYARTMQNVVSEFQTWTNDSLSVCKGGFTGYANEFALLHQVSIDQHYCKSNRKGGEYLEDVVLQNEDIEYYTYQKGCFQLLCDQNASQNLDIEYRFNRNSHLNQYMSSLQLLPQVPNVPSESNIVAKFTIAVTRYEYANLYHTMTDWYNAYLLMQFFNKTQSETDILIIDSHPRGVLDPVWPVLFNSVKRLSQINTQTMFSQLVWSIQGYNSPLLIHDGTQVSIPLIEEFRTFVLSSFGIPDDHKLDCKALRVTFLWRRDYVAHPRRPDGKVERKIQNEQELLEHVQNTYPSFWVRGLQIDQFEMKQQLRFIVDTDILIGMHGAGLTHALFLSLGSALIELQPYYSSGKFHFTCIARWRDLVYEKWENTNESLELSDFFTKIPVDVFDSLLLKAHSKMCS